MFYIVEIISRCILVGLLSDLAYKSMGIIYRFSKGCIRYVRTVDDPNDKFPRYYWQVTKELVIDIAKLLVFVVLVSYNLHMLIGIILYLLGVI